MAESDGETSAATGAAALHGSGWGAENSRGFVDAVAQCVDEN
jgi:hypothetical protein